MEDKVEPYSKDEMRSKSQFLVDAFERHRLRILAELNIICIESPGYFQCRRHLCSTLEMDDFKRFLIAEWGIGTILKEGTLLNAYTYLVALHILIDYMKEENVTLPIFAGEIKNDEQQ